jgi:WD40 repeat protein
LLPPLRRWWPGPRGARGPLLAGTTIAAGTTKGNVYLYDTTSYRLQGKLTAAGSNAVTALAYAPGGVSLAVGYANGTTAQWDTATEKATAHLSVPGSGKAVKGLAFAPTRACSPLPTRLAARTCGGSRRFRDAVAFSTPIYGVG